MHDIVIINYVSIHTRPLQN